MVTTLIKIELHKLLLSRSAQVIFLLFLLLSILSILFVTTLMGEIPVDENAAVDPRQFLSFPMVWEMISYQISYAALLLPALIAILTCTELNSGIIRQHIIEGLSRKELVAGKLLTIVFLSGLATLLFVIAGFLVGMAFTESAGLSDIVEGSTAIFRFLLYIAGVSVLAYTFAVFIGSTGTTLISLLGYLIIIEPTIVLVVDHPIVDFLPNASFRQLLNFPIFELIRGTEADYTRAAIATTGWLIVLSLLSYYRVNRKDY